LSPSTFYEIRLNRFYSEYKRYVFEDPNTVPKYFVRVAADSTNNTPELILDLDIAEDVALFDSVKNNRITYEYFIDPNGPVGYVHPDSIAAPVSDSFYKVGMDMKHSNRSTAYWLGKFDLTSQITRTHQIKTGFEFRQYELKLDEYTLIPKTVGGEEIKPFVPAIPEVSSIYHDAYTHKPVELAAYVQDKIEFNEIIMNIGLRFDYFDADASIPVDPTDTNIYNPFKDENKYKNPNAPDNEKVEYTPEERKAFMLKVVKPKHKISPRLGIAYPITDKGIIHFSYGHFYQIPEFQYLYVSPDYKFTSGGGGSYRLFGNPDLKPQQTVMYEIGLQQQLTNVIGIDITLFYRDVRDWVSTSTLISTFFPDTKYSIYENKDYANVRGITFKFEKRYANHFAAKLDYTYQIAEGTYSAPKDAFDAITSKDEPRRVLIPMLWDQPHTVNASLIFGIGGWNASLIGRYWSGKPYTPAFPSGEVLGESASTGLRENSARLPSQKSVDMYIDRKFPIGALNLTLFINVYNIFDQRDEITVYGDSGTAEYTTTINPAKIPYDPARVGTIEHFVLQSGWYTSPREIHAGVEINF
jgi:outer membrane receptor protein involved in Fe transport